MGARMKLSDFDFDLPEELIALRPAIPRDSARLLVVRGSEGLLEDRSVRDLPELLKAGDILVARVLTGQLDSLIGLFKITGTGNKQQGTLLAFDDLTPMKTC